MGVLRAVSPEMLESPNQTWQIHTKSILEVIKGRKAGDRFTIEEASALYLKSLFRRGQSASTIKRYYYYLKAFNEWCESNGIMNLSINKLEIRAFIGYCKRERGLGMASIRQYYWKLKGFFSYLVEEGFIQEHPMEFMAIPTHGSKKVKQVISTEEVSRLLNTVLTEYEALPIHYRKRRFLVFRDLVIIELLLATGLRVSELGSLTIQDIDLVNGLLYVQGKGSDLYIKRNRIAFIDLPILKNDLKTYLNLHQGNRNSPLFPSKQDRPFSPAGFDVMVKKWGQKAGIPKKLSCHLFRHTFCTQLVLNGADIYSVQKLMGHHDVETTLNFYLHLTPEEVKADWKRFSPLVGRES